jgi:hypothetical protein
LTCVFAAKKNWACNWRQNAHLINRQLSRKKRGGSTCLKLAGCTLSYFTAGCKLAKPLKERKESMGGNKKETRLAANFLDNTN